MGNYLETKVKEECTGCGVCALVCPKKCINMVEDEEGFLYPVINETECIKCNKCISVCKKKIGNNYIEKSYAVYNKDEKERKTSSSGGFFPLLAQNVINNDGHVYGVCYDENMQVVHRMAKNIDECKKFKGSKYVRSNFGGIFKAIEQDLINGKKVLFTGTPCEADGLRKFLNKEYENLLICDIICHSNPSPQIFKKYISYLEQKYKSKVIDINFRDKNKGWHNPNIVVKFDNRKKVSDKVFYNAFIRGLISRPSCYNCKYTSTKRISDITIGDFWGVEKIKPEIDDNKGISIIIINSKKGEEVFNKIQQKLICYEISIEDSIKYNHNSPIKENVNKKKIFDKIDDDKKLLSILKRKSKIFEMKQSISNIMPNQAKNVIKKIIKK